MYGLQDTKQESLYIIPVYLLMYLQKLMTSLFEHYVMNPSAAPPKGGLLWRSAAYKSFKRQRKELLTHWRANARLMARIAAANEANLYPEVVRLPTKGPRWNSTLLSNVIHIRIEWELPADYYWVGGVVVSTIYLLKAPNHQLLTALTSRKRLRMTQCHRRSMRPG